MSKSNTKNVASVKGANTGAVKSIKAPPRKSVKTAPQNAPSIADAFAEMGAREVSTLVAPPTLESFVAPLAPPQTSAEGAPSDGAPKMRVEHANGAAFTATRPGVLAHIENLLRRATAEAPVSKSEILASLVVAFADRDEAKMKVTLSMQVPSGFKIEKGFIISKVEGKGYYFNVAATAAYQLTHEKRGGKWVPKKVEPTVVPPAAS